MNLKSQNNIFALDEISNAMFTCEMRGSSVDAAPKQNCKRFLRFSVKKSAFTVNAAAEATSAF